MASYFCWLSDQNWKSRTCQMRRHDGSLIRLLLLVRCPACAADGLKERTGLRPGDTASPFFFFFALETSNHPCPVPFPGLSWILPFRGGYAKLHRVPRPVAPNAMQDFSAPCKGTSCSRPVLVPPSVPPSISSYPPTTTRCVKSWEAGSWVTSTFPMTVRGGQVQAI